MRFRAEAEKSACPYVLPTLGLVYKIPANLTASRTTDWYPIYVGLCCEPGCGTPGNATSAQTGDLAYWEKEEYLGTSPKATRHPAYDLHYWRN
jgi:hypothetical protein